MDYERQGVEGYEEVNLWAGWLEEERRMGEPYRCPRCKTTRLECLPTDDYETSVRCPDCKVWTVVHEG